MINAFLHDLNLAVPKLQVTLNDILHVFSGYLPVKLSGGVELTKREVIIDHAETGGLKGLYSVSGIKFTTARRVADKVLKKAFPQRNRFKGEGFVKSDYNQNGWMEGRIFDPGWKFNRDSTQAKSLKDVVENEAVITVDDLLYRRTNLWEISLCSPDLRRRLQMELQLSTALGTPDEDSGKNSKIQGVD
jgi:glycerol-3-phosphate dehydrogenase